MRSITLYKIVDPQGNGSFQAAQAYKLYSDKIPTIPNNIRMKGLCMSYNMAEDVYEKFAEQLLDVLEQHNAPKMLDKWTDITDPTFQTVSICVDDILLAPDFHNNLTSWKTHPDDIKRLYDKLHNAVQAASSQQIKPINFDNKWYDECLRDIKKAELNDKWFSDCLNLMKNN